MAHNHPWLLYFDSLSTNGLNVSCSGCSFNERKNLPCPT